MREKKTGLWLGHIISWSGCQLYVTLNGSLGEESKKSVSITPISRFLQVHVPLSAMANAESGSSPEPWGRAPQTPQDSLEVAV